MQETVIYRWLNVWLDPVDELGSRVGGSTDFQLSLYLASEIEWFHFASSMFWLMTKRMKWKKNLGLQSNSKYNTSLLSLQQNFVLLKEITQAFGTI